MSSEEAINKQLVELQEETEKTERELQAHMRNKMAPIWNKRRDIVKQIPNFWTRVVSSIQQPLHTQASYIDPNTVLD